MVHSIEQHLRLLSPILQGLEYNHSNCYYQCIYSIWRKCNYCLLEIQENSIPVPRQLQSHIQELLCRSNSHVSGGAIDNVSISTGGKHILHQLLLFNIWNYSSNRMQLVLQQSILLVWLPQLVLIHRSMGSWNWSNTWYWVYCCTNTIF